jgi:MFS family permease
VNQLLSDYSLKDSKKMTMNPNTEAIALTIKTPLVSRAYLATLFSICFLSILFGGIVSTLMSVYLPVAVKDLLGTAGANHLNSISGYINAAFVFGWAIGGFLWGIIGDRIGRKKTIIYSIACYGLFTMLTGYAFSWGSVVGCRFMSGFGMGGVLVVTTTIMIEEWPEKTRAIFMGILSISMPVGIFSAGMINRLTNNWRDGFMIGIVPLGIALASFWLIKESGKWKNNHSLEAQHPKNTVSIFSGIHRSDLIAGSIIFGTMLIGLWAVFSWIPTWIQSLITGSDGNRERSTSMMIFGIGGLTGGFLSGWIVNAIGSRKSMLLCFGVCSLLAFLLFRTNASFTSIIYIEISLMALFFGISQGVLSVYIPSLFPTSIRSTATGFCFNIGRLFTATAVLFIGVLESFFGSYSNALLVFSSVFAIGFVSTLFAKERKITENE